MQFGFNLTNGQRLHLTLDANSYVHGYLLTGAHGMIESGNRQGDIYYSDFIRSRGWVVAD